MDPTSLIPKTLAFAVLLGACTLAGCGTIKGRAATEQLVVSDAVDQSIQQIDFSSLVGEDIFLDVQFIRSVRGVGFVNSEYIISSLRQRMISANCRLQESKDKAKYIVEVRVGALGSDCHDINYGVPGSQAVNQTASLLTSAPLPSVPEISLAKTDACRAAAKISLFAYERETRQPVWESGNAQGISVAKSTWVLGAGPFQKGAIYDNAAELQTIELPNVHGGSHGRAMLAKMRKPFQRRVVAEEALQDLPQIAATPTPEIADAPMPEIAAAPTPDIQASPDPVEISEEDGTP